MLQVWTANSFLVLWNISLLSHRLNFLKGLQKIIPLFQSYVREKWHLVLIPSSFLVVFLWKEALRTGHCWYWSMKFDDMVRDKMMVCFMVLGRNRREELKCRAYALYTGLCILHNCYRKKEEFVSTEPYAKWAICTKRKRNIWIIKIVLYPPIICGSFPHLWCQALFSEVCFSSGS